ncbi:MAG: SIS domain-containing protein [Anaerolineae bacterium]|nr:SIS domain-containing protein [Anaerolineae bacterium]
MTDLTHSHLYQEIHQQPQVLARLLDEGKESIQALANAIQERQISHVVIAARGTSDNAGRYAKYLLGAVNHLPVGLATPSLFSVYEQPPTFGNALVLGISQSGKSPDIVSVLAEAQRQGALTATLTNFPGSNLGKVADYVIDLRAGEEKAVAATKTYTSELAAIALLSSALCGDACITNALETIPEKVAATLKLHTQIAQVAERYRYMQTCVTIGRGYNYATAFELSLKLKELTYTVVEPYSSADFMHGPLALIEHGFPVIVIAPSGRLLPEMKTFIHTLKVREAEVIVISDDAEALSIARVPLALPEGVPEWLSPLTAIVPGQLFAMYLAHAKDYDPDHPRGLLKVTETR